MVTGVFFAFSFNYGFFGIHVNCFPLSIWIWILTILATKCCFLFIFREVTLHFARTTLGFCGLSWLLCTGFSCIFATKLHPTRLAITRATLAKPVTQRTIATFVSFTYRTSTIAITISIATITILFGFCFIFHRMTIFFS